MITDLEIDDDDDVYCMSVQETTTIYTGKSKVDVNVFLFYNTHTTNIRVDGRLQ